MAVCSECQGVIAGGRSACQQLYDAFVYEALEDVRLGAVHALAFDAYCMQHVETYCVSAKSYCAHLTRLCVAMDYADMSTRQLLYATLQRWYHGKVVKPPVLEERGTMTFVEVQAITDVPAKVAKIAEWSLGVWLAYASQHAQARAWIQEATG